MFASRLSLSVSRSFSRFSSSSSTLKSQYDNILAEVRGKTGLITLNRPKALNALSSPLLADITHAARCFDADENVGAIVITGSEKAFAAGADIKEMSAKTFPETYVYNMFEDWTNVARIRKPVRFSPSLSLSSLNLYLLLISLSRPLLLLLDMH